MVRLICVTHSVSVGVRADDGGIRKTKVAPPKQFHPFLIHDHFRDRVPWVCRLGLHLIRLPNIFVYLGECLTGQN